MTGTKYASAVEHRSALSSRRPGRRTSILMIGAKYGLNIGPRPSVLGNRRLLVRRAVASVLASVRRNRVTPCQLAGFLFTARATADSPLMLVRVTSAPWSRWMVLHGGKHERRAAVLVLAVRRLDISCDNRLARGSREILVADVYVRPI